MHRSLTAAAALLVFSCFDPAAEGPPTPTAQRRLDVLEGELCSQPPGAMRPLKLLVALDGSQSAQVTDPDGSRARAVAALIAALPTNVETWAGVMLFSGSASRSVVAPFHQEFVRTSEISATERAAIGDRIVDFVAPSGAGNGTDFVAAFATIRALISRDLTSDVVAGRPTASYAVVFVSDGAPTANQDDELLCGDAVSGVRALRDLAGDVRVHTAFVFRPSQPVSTSCTDAPPSGPSVCGLPLTTPATCPAHVVDLNRERLRRIAVLGGGEFREFRDSLPVDFGFVAERLVPPFSLGTVVVSNLNAAPSTGEPDSDADGLTDALEATLGTNAGQRDSDGDGFSDGVEHWVDLGKERDPTRLARLMQGCRTRDVDSDCDGLTDCDEQVLSSNASRADTDDDGLPDAVEFQHATRPELTDHLTDFDVDGVPNGDEVRRHTDPWKQDPSKPERAYRYTLEPAATAGCFKLRVENIRLPVTLSGQSTLMLSASLKADGTPERPLAAATRFTAVAGEPIPGFTAGDVRVGCR